jgi:hypothetical protein
MCVYSDRVASTKSWRRSGPELVQEFPGCQRAPRHGRARLPALLPRQARGPPGKSARGRPASPGLAAGASLQSRHRQAAQRRLRATAGAPERLRGRGRPGERQVAPLPPAGSRDRVPWPALSRDTNRYKATRHGPVRGRRLTAGAPPASRSAPPEPTGSALSVDRGSRFRRGGTAATPARPAGRADRGRPRAPGPGPAERAPFAETPGRFLVASASGGGYKTGKGAGRHPRPARPAVGLSQPCGRRTASFGTGGAITAQINC